MTINAKKDVNMNDNSINNQLSVGMLQALHNGYCINSAGNMFSGSSAAQDAINDVNGNEAIVWLGKGTFGPIELQKRRLLVQGMGEETIIDGGTTNHACYIHDSASAGTWRNQLRDLTLTTTNGGGNPYDGLHIEGGVNGTGNSHVVTENWFNNVQIQGADRYGVFLGGSEKVGALYFSGLFVEGADEDPLYIGQKARENHISAEYLNGDVAELIYIDGRDNQIFVPNITYTGGTEEVKFGPNSYRNFVFCPFAPLFTNNGADSNFWIARTFSLPHFPRGTFTGKVISSDNELYQGHSTSTTYDGGTSSHGLEITGGKVTVRGGRYQTTEGGGSAYDAINISGKNFVLDGGFVFSSDRYGLYIGSTVKHNRIVNSLFYGFSCDSDTIHVDGSNNVIMGNTCNGQGTIVLNGDNNAVVGNVGGWTITDNGTGNQVANNT